MPRLLEEAVTSNRELWLEQEVEATRIKLEQAEADLKALTEPLKEVIALTHAIMAWTRKAREVKRGLFKAIQRLPKCSIAGCNELATHTMSSAKFGDPHRFRCDAHRDQRWAYHKLEYTDDLRSLLDLVREAEKDAKAEAKGILSAALKEPTKQKRRKRVS